MRVDHITTFNTNLEQNCTYVDQMVAFHEQEIAKLKAFKRACQSLGSTEPAEGDVAIDVKPFALPSIFRLNPEQQRQHFSRSAPGLGTIAPQKSLEEMEQDLRKTIESEAGKTEAA